MIEIEKHAIMLYIFIVTNIMGFGVANLYLSTQYSIYAFWHAAWDYFGMSGGSLNLNTGAELDLKIVLYVIIFFPN